MIGRILLLILAWFGIQEAIAGFRVPREPTEMSVSRFQQLGRQAPPFVHITGVIPHDGVCLETSFSQGGDELTTDELYVPLVTAQQAAAIAAGVETTVPSFVVHDDCGEPIERTWIRGLVEPGGAGGLDREVREEFEKAGIRIGDGAALVRPQDAPISPLGNALILLLAILAATAAIVPFFGRRRWPRERELENCTNEEVFGALYPLLRVHNERGKDASQALKAAGDAADEEIVILVVNCLDSANRAALAVFTNRRYILYRTRAQWVLRALGLVERLIDKVPVFGGLLSSLVTPFAETYQLVISPQHKICRETMAYDDRALIAGKVPWSAKCDMRWGEVARRCKSVSIRKSFWSGRLEVDFVARTLFGLFRAPAGFSIEQLGVRVAAARVIGILEERLLRLGCRVERSGSNLAIEVGGGEPAAA